MEQAKWQNIKSVLSATLDLPENERGQFLAREADPEIRAGVEKLLSAFEKAGSFIEKPLLIENGLAEDETIDKLVGRRIENYLILEKIGSGGMGAVYLAERLNSDFKQKVALKLIKRGMDSDAIFRRFANERRILASLKHPNIAQLIDGGVSSEGLPFFVLEYVEGKPLNQFCRETRLSLEERLRIFRRICSAVEHAHKNLVIHRDLKPSNILVTEDRVPKLLDFGIAKLLAEDDSETTISMTTGKMFTPEYASPEQILGKTVTTSTDVYSLGVVLYELLTGHRPYDVKGKSYDEVIKSVCETEPRRPSATGEYRNLTTVNEPETAQIPKNQLRGDLDNIILKSLRKEPSERYGSVHQLSEDISRFLKGLPVLARPQTLGYRFGKYFKRHKVSVVAAALVLMSLFAGISVATWQAVVAGRERAKAEARFNDVRALANSLMFEVHDSIKDLSGSTPARKLLVRRALDYLDKLADESKNDMTLQSELAEGYEKIGDVQGGALNSNLGDTAGALESYGKALAIRENLAVSPGGFDQQYAAALLHSKIFRVMMQINDFAEAEFHCRRAITILDELIISEPENLLFKVTSARFYLELGDLLVSKKDGNAGEGLQNYRQSIAVAEAIPEVGALDEKLADGLSIREKIFSVTQMAYRRIGQNAQLRNQPKEAFEAYLKALEASRKLAAAADPPKPQSQIVLAIALGNVGRMEAKEGKFEQAFANTQNMLDICEKVVKADPQNYLAVSQLSLAQGSLGFVYSKRGDFQKSLEHLQKSREIQENIREKQPDDIYNIGNLGETLAYIGEVYEELAKDRTSPKNNLLEAKNWHKRSLDIWLDLRKNGKLPAYFAGKIEEQEKAVARCEAGLSK